MIGLFCAAGGWASGAEVTVPPSFEEKLQAKISLDLRDMDVVDVYKFLAVKGNFNITLSKNIAGRVTLYLKNVAIKDALDIISIGNNLAYIFMGEDIIYVMTEDEHMATYGKRFNDRRELSIVHLKYAKPAYVLEALKNIKSEIGKVVIDEETGSVVLMDTREDITRMEDLIERIDQPLEVKVYTLKYANAEDVAVKLKSKIENKAVGAVQADIRSNQLIISAFPDRVKEIDQIVAALDKKTKAVMIDVRILKVILNPKMDIGIDWEGLFRKVSDLDFAGSFPISTTISQASSIGTVGKIGVGKIDDDDFSFELKMLKQVIDTKVLANPSIMVTNNQEAKIHIGDKLAYVTTTTIGVGESARTNEEINFIDVGVQFRVTPTINDDGFVMMKIQPEISSRSGELTTPQNAKVPLINTTSVETNVLVKDGHTIAIGGLRQDETSHSKKGVPGLMDVPLFGRAFSNQSDEKTQTEIVILLTPHVVEGDEDFVDQKLQVQQGIKGKKSY